MTPVLLDALPGRLEITLVNRLFFGPSTWVPNGLLL